MDQQVLIHGMILLQCMIGNEFKGEIVKQCQTWTIDTPLLENAYPVSFSTLRHMFEMGQADGKCDNMYGLVCDYDVGRRATKLVAPSFTLTQTS